MHACANEAVSRWRALRRHNLRLRYKMTGFAASAQHNANEIGRILRSELFHDACAMDLDGARTDAEQTASLLIRRTGGNLLKHLAFARREQVAAGKTRRQEFVRLRGCPSPRPCS